MTAIARGVFRAVRIPVASYSAGRDIAAKLISEPSKGTNLDIAATDQIRPIATAIPTIHARICIPSGRVELGEIGGSHTFRRPNVRQFTDAQIFLKQGPRKAKEMAMTGIGPGLFVKQPRLGHPWPYECAGPTHRPQPAR